MSKVILYIATSKDGFIADQDGSVDWLPGPEADPNDLAGYKHFLSRIKYIFMGSVSYKQILSFGEWGWPDKMTYVFTSDKTLPDMPNVKYTNSNPSDFMKKFKSEHTDTDVDIWLLGGAKLAKSFAIEQLIDELVITIIPKQLEKGIKLELPFDQFELKETKNCGNGMYQKIYCKVNEKI